MRFKLARGKFRPSLQGYIDRLTNKECIEATKKGFKAYRKKQDIHQALKELCVLRGVGFATASLILSVVFPTCPFLADESYLSIPSM